jgi:hypothetical protein
MSADDKTKAFDALMAELAELALEKRHDEMAAALVKAVAIKLADTEAAGPVAESAARLVARIVAQNATARLQAAYAAQKIASIEKQRVMAEMVFREAIDEHCRNVRATGDAALSDIAEMLRISATGLDARLARIEQQLESRGTPSARDASPTRRGLMKGAAILLAALGIKTFEKTFLGSSRREGRELLREVLGMYSDDEIALVPNWENVALAQTAGSYVPSFATITAARATADLLRNDDAPIKIVDEPIDYDAETNHVFAFGFETSQPIYRHVAGWHRFDKDHGDEFRGYERFTGPLPYTLPWASNLGTEEDPTRADRHYFSLIDGKETKRRIWSLSSNGGSPLFPEFDRDTKQCKVDYVSIVHVPSFLAQADGSRMLTLIGGIQAAGTKQVGAMLAKEAGLLASLQQQPAASASAWQAIVRVDFTDGPTPGFYLHDVSPVKVDELALASWRRNPPTF